MRRQLRVVLGLCALCALSWATCGKEIVVSTDGSGAYRSIQRAVDAADYGDVILVNPGVYEEVLVLRSGISIRGAGPSHTIIRSSYGYDPVLRASIVGAVTLESLALERAPSILEAVVVDITSSQIVFRDCRITGGQLGGVRSSGLSLLTFESCEVESNHGFGMEISGAEQVSITATTISENSSVGIHLSDATASLVDTSVQSNGSNGLQAEGQSFATVRGTSFEYNSRWGVRLTGSSQADFENCSFHAQALGGVRIEDAASVSLVICTLDGGNEEGVYALDAAQVYADRIQITNARGDGVRADGQATLDLVRTAIAYNGGSGVSMESAGTCHLDHVTVAYNDGVGLFFRGQGPIEVTESIVALNGGSGIRVSSPAGTDMRFAFNNVWGNALGEYEGVQRSSSDISEPPEFFDPEAGDFSLWPFSACGEAGLYGVTLGAFDSPWWYRGGRIGLGVSHAFPSLGQWEAVGRWDALSLEFLGGDASWEIEREPMHLEIAASMARSLHLRTEATLGYEPTSGLSIAGWDIVPALRLFGVLDGAASRWRASGSLEVLGPSAELRTAASWEMPTRLTRQSVDARWGPVTVSAAATNLTVTDLALGWSTPAVSDDGGAGFTGTIQLIPQPLVSLSVGVATEEGVLRIAASAFPEQLGTVTTSISWAAPAVQVSATLRLRETQFEDLETSVRLEGPVFSISGMLAANATYGPRIRVELFIDTAGWFSPPKNNPPIPNYSYLPLEPEAGEQITFDASETYDPDGEIDQIWWDFGDGESAMGALVKHVYSEAGTYAVTLTVSDEDGAVTTWVDTFVVREAQTTPVAAFTWSPVSEGGVRLPRAVRAGDLVLLDASGSRDPNGSIVEYAWDLQSDGSFDRTSSDARIVIDPLSAGSWPVTLRVVDEDGNSDAVMHVLTIAELKPPEAQFEISPTTPAVGDPVRFLDVSVETDEPIVSWEWDFGDGHSAREPEPTHRYPASGMYQVRLTVRDAAGLTDTSTREVPVEVNPELVPVQEVWAVVIGITDYQEVEDLSYAAQDARSIASWLIDNGVPVDHIRLLTDPDSSIESPDGDTLLSHPATLVNVREALGWLRQVAHRDDLVLIHFSGHGYQGSDDNLDELDGVDEFFVLEDTRAAAKDDTALRDDEFGRFLDRIASEHVLVFFDSCYSGGLSRSLPPGSRATGDTPDVFSDFNLEGRLILSASQESQDAFESPQLEHGVLTYFILKGLRGAADLNDDGHVTVWELFGYVRDEVPPFVEAERGEIQIPQLIGEGESRVVLAQTLSEESAAFSYCPALPYAGAAVFFRSELIAMPGTARLEWAFGDGVSAQGDVVSHVYEEPGTYLVQHSVQIDDGAIRSRTMRIDVGDKATVVSIDEPDRRVVISVGRQHGVAVGDRFGLISNPRDDASTAELEVVESIDETTSICRVLGATPMPSIGAALRPLPGETQAPCFDDP